MAGSFGCFLGDFRLLSYETQVKTSDSYAQLDTTTENRETK